MSMFQPCYFYRNKEGKLVKFAPIRKVQEKKQEPQKPNKEGVR